jgi:hypothetical protein
LTQNLVKVIVEEGEFIERQATGLNEEDVISGESQTGMTTRDRQLGVTINSRPRLMQRSEKESLFQKVFRTWDHFLHLLGNPMGLEDLDCRKIAVDAIITSIGYFLDLIEKPKTKSREEKIANAGKKKSNVIPREFLPRGNTLLSIYGPWLFDICRLNVPKLLTTKAECYAVLCRLFCIRFDQPFERSFLSIFYIALHQGLCYGHPAVQQAIIRNSESIFCVDLPGVSILIPDFVEVCFKVIKNSDDADPSLRKSSMTILYSLIPLGTQFGDVTLPDLDTVVLPDVADEKLLQDRLSLSNTYRPHNYKELRPILLKCFSKGILQEKDEQLQIMSLWGLNAFLHNELIHRSIDKKTMMESIETILGYVSYTNKIQVARTSIEVLRTLATRFDELSALSSDLLEAFFRGYSGNAMSLAYIVRDGSHPNCEAAAVILAELLYCLIEWVMAIPPDMFGDNPITNDIFNLLEVCLTFPDAESKQPDPPENPSQRLSRMRQSSNAVHQDSSISSKTYGPSIKEATISAIQHFVNHVNFFPLHAGIDIISSQVSETNDPDDETLLQGTQLKSGGHQTSSNSSDDEKLSSSHIYLVYKDTSLISLSERTQIAINGKKEKVARMILRDMTGKYCWDFKMTTPSNLVDLLFMGSEKRKADSMGNVFVQPVGSDETSPSNTQNNSEGEDNKSGDDASGSSKQDLLSSVLDMIDHQYDPALWIKPLESGEFGLASINRGEENSFNALAATLAAATGMKNSPEGKSASVEQDALSKRIIELMDRVNQMKTEEAESSSLNGKRADIDVRESFISPEGMSTTPSFDQCRLLLAHLSFIDSFSNEIDEELKLLENNDKLQRSLKLLDQIYSRECHKIGVIYVGPNQEHQRKVLQNDRGGADYENFIDNIGWNVDVTRHRGFLGGLDPRYTTGTYAPYWASSTMEMIFHVATRMPTNWADPQQIHKKRQVGNDHVHIVWSDHSRDYVPSTISSSFNDAHIVIYPIRNKLYRIQIHAKDKVPSFGPLRNGMVVTQETLVPLVRMTALNANRAVRHSTPGYDRPYPTRKKYIDDIISRHCKSLSKRELLSVFFAPPAKQTKPIAE